MSTFASRRSRVLIVDDAPEIHADFHKLLGAEGRRARFDPALALLRGEPDGGAREAPEATFELASAHQGDQALALVEASFAAGEPFALAFVDMRMPPGWDGLETIERVLRVDPHLQTVICTAYSDHDWPEIRRRLGPRDNVLILKKPFDPIEARQMTWALCEKWHLARESERKEAALEAKLCELAFEVERRAGAETRLIHDALHDALTDLPNRTLISDRIERSLALAKRDPAYRFAIGFVDLDDFKVVNDSLGHDAGDRLLVQIARRIDTCIRQTDCASRNVGSAAARLGGDEFLFLLDGLRAPEDAHYVAERILECISQPVTIEDHELRPCASIGIALGSADYDDAVSLIRDADTALYRAKANGKATVAFFDSELRREALARLRVESELRAAIQAGHLFLQYQPIVDLSDLRIRGFEALVRWRHPEQGVIPPGEFVPLAEERGLILPLGEWVLRRACEQTAQWRRSLPNAAGVFVNVNFSSKQLAAPKFVAGLREVLEESGLDADHLHVELTESLLLQCVSPAVRTVQKLHDEGFALHVDDFGTGAMALSYLNKLPVSAVKIDRAFLRSFGSRPDLTMIKAVIEMAHARGLQVVAEGIETAEQLGLLQHLGCDMGQGFYFAQPLDPEQVQHILATRMTIAA